MSITTLTAFTPLHAHEVQPQPSQVFTARAERRGATVVCAAGQPKKQKLMWEALREATDEEMEKDPTVCVIGEHFLHYRTWKATHACKW